MSIRSDENTKARAVGLVREHHDDYDSERAATKAIAGRLGMSTDTLRRWVRQAEVDAGDASGVSSEGRGVARAMPRPGSSSKPPPGSIFRSCCPMAGFISRPSAGGPDA